jgi:hypothetical protein
MMSAAATLTGNAIGAGDGERRRATARLIFLCEITMMLLSASLLFAYAPTMVRLFSRDAAVIALGSTVLRMVALSEPFYGVSIVTEGMLQGAGKMKAAFAFNLCGMWGVRIVGTFLCTRLLGFGLVAAWGCMIGHNLLLFVLFTAYYRRGNWLPPEMREPPRSVFVPPRSPPIRPGCCSTRSTGSAPTSPPRSSRSTAPWPNCGATWPRHTPSRRRAIREGPSPRPRPEPNRRSPTCRPRSPITTSTVVYSMKSKKILLSKLS